MAAHSYTKIGAIRMKVKHDSPNSAQNDMLFHMQNICRYLAYR